MLVCIILFLVCNDQDIIYTQHYMLLCNPYNLKNMFFYLISSIASSFSCSAQVADVQPHLVFTGGLLVDGSGEAPIENSVVAVVEDRIVFAGEADSFEIPPHTDVFDIAGNTILPGFFNAHVLQALSEEKLRAWAWEGVTTVRLLGSNHEELNS